MNPFRLLRGCLAAALASVSCTRAEMTWSSYDSSGNRVSANAAAFDPATATYNLTIPANSSRTFVTTSFVPITVTQPASGRTLTPVGFSMAASGGYGTAGSVQNKYTAMGLFTTSGTAPGATGNFTDDKGLWITFYQQSAPSFNTKPSGVKSGAPTCPVNLLGTSAGTYGLGTANGGNIGVIVDNQVVDVVFTPVLNSNGTWSTGNTTNLPATATNAPGGVFIDRATGGTLLKRTTYSDTSTSLSGTQTFNEFGFLFENGTASAVTLSLSAFTLVGPPYLVVQPPPAASVITGGSLTLSTTSGGAPTSYQWEKSTDGGGNYATVPGATSAAYTFDNAQAGDAGLYRVVVTNAAGSTTSTATEVTVTTSAVAPVVQTQPAGGTVLVGATKTFSVLANGTTPLAYEWQISTDGGANYTAIAGATEQTHTISPVTLADDAWYRVVVSNTAGSATSDPAVLVVQELPAITTQPVGTVLPTGSPFTLSVVGTGTPAPTYQWKRNGVAIPDATAPTYSVASATGANTGNYTVTLTNAAGSTTSSIASIAVLASGFTSTATTPSVGAVSVLPDTRLSVTFNQAVTVGVSGFIKIHDASNNALVDTVDLVAATTLKNVLRPGSPLSIRDLPVQNKTIGTLTNFNYYPITTSGNTATIYPRNGVLAYNKSYYVTIDAGVFVDATGGSFAGIEGTSAWTFSTRASGPVPGTPTLTVAADGSGDFYTVQGALDSLPPGNTTPTTLFIRTGTYFETVYFTAKNNITFLGESRSGTIIEYPNNNNLNNVSGVYHRMTFYGNSVSGVTLANLTFLNSTPQGGSQAEALIMGGNVTTAHNLITGVDFYSYQDTVQFNGQIYLSDCRIEGDVDFMWGSGPAFFKNCDIKMLRAGGSYLTQVRNPQTNHGFVYVDCRLTAIPGSTGNYLARIDPSGFPYSEVVWINCSVTDFLLPAAWKFDNASTGPNVRFWEYNFTNPATGLPVDLSGRASFSKQLVQPTDATDITNYSTPSYVLGGGWTPALAPLITSHPQGVNLDPGQTLTLQVSAIAVPAASYEWYKGADPIDGATSATYSVGSVSSANAGIYSVVVTNSVSSATSTSATVTVTPTAIETWRQTHFGSPDNTGDAADTADPDGDGVSNLMEFAIGTAPMSSSGAALQYSGTLAGGGTVVAPGLPITLIETIVTGADMRAVYSRRKDYAAAGLTITPQFSNDLTTWENSPAAPVILADDGSAQIVSVTYTRILSNGRKAAFFRLLVSRN